MKTASSFFLAAIASLLACAVHGDDVEKTPGRDNPVLKTILAPDLRIDGRWIGVIRRGFEEHSLTIETNADEKGAYRLKFYSWTDIAGTSKATRSGKLVEGVISLDEPIKGFGISKSPFSALYTVRAEGKEYLLPAVNVEELKSADDVKPRIAYLFQRRSEK